MPRKKLIPRKTQTFELQNDVKVTIEFPVGSVRWKATHNAVSIATGDADDSALSLESGQSVTRPSSEPPFDSKIEELKKRLPKDPTLGGLGNTTSKPYTSQDAFADAGIQISQSELSEALGVGETVV